jgi:hypothetical protein
MLMPGCLTFLLKNKGAGSAGIGLALSLLFVGGAFGKLFCGYPGARIGMMKTVWATESLTALCIVLAARARCRRCCSSGWVMCWAPLAWRVQKSLCATLGCP